MESTFITSKTEATEEENLTHVNKKESYIKLHQELVELTFNSSNQVPKLVNASCFDFLLMESMALFLNQSIDNSFNLNNSIDKQQSSQLLTPLTPTPSNLGSFQLTPGLLRDREETNLNREMLYFKLENMGFRVGLGLAERFTIDRELFNDTLDIIKFICKEFWYLLFKKQIDSLKTNHRGIYALSDNSFQWFQRLSTVDPPSVTARQAIFYTWFPCGLIRGALFGLGLNSVVVAEAVTLPQCTFQIKVGKEQ